MEFPVEVALADLVPALPAAPGWWFEIKLDGHRTVMWRTTDGVRLSAGRPRPGRGGWQRDEITGLSGRSCLFLHAGRARQERQPTTLEQPSAVLTDDEVVVLTERVGRPGDAVGDVNPL
ncbi:hypothetical protein [Streptomyces sp. NPDC059455]|uniref:hypothetical protein n=1 Tax=Streptomyces sp. NPDC059455 TaxID=3346837 RepID=UPI00368608D8